MSKVAHYLQEHLLGEVMTSSDTRRFFATDASVFTLAPSIVVYPRSEGDVRKVARFAWQLAERGRAIPITARGAGTDQGGAAIGSGIMLVFPAHMNRIVEFDNKSGNVIVEPGINYAKLQQALETHGRFLPPFPASFEYSTIGGAIGNNAGGEKTVKYGDTRAFVKSLRVVLANGEVIETGRISKRELGKKLGLATFEGEIYRSLDTLLDEQDVSQTQLPVTKNSAGYALANVRGKDGSFDLTPLFVGSQGTLGIITEATMTTQPHNPTTTLLVAAFDNLQQAQAAVLELRQLKEKPSAMEMVDRHLLEAVARLNPNQLRSVISEPYPQLVMLIEFDDANDRTQKKAAKKAAKILTTYATGFQMETDPLKQAELWRIRHSSATVMANAEGQAKAVPIIEDGIVPVDKFAVYLEGVYDIFRKNGLEVAIWGHAGDANLHLSPYLDLSTTGDRQKAFKVIEEYYRLVIGLGGSTSGEHNDGRLRGPYLEALYGAPTYAIFQKVKQIFDPFGTLNTGVKVNVGLDDIKPLLRHQYDLKHLYQHMPRT